ncbi:MAG: hypothetical protein K9M15_02050 [Candidatus Marinimicrobia bacterium]|nr:hypothetical protein [Candidatus Neomarinimicrobiota bacterium]
MKRLRFLITKLWAQKIRGFLFFTLEYSVWGRAILHLAFDKYTQSHLFQVRAKNHGRYFAAESMQVYDLERYKMVVLKQNLLLILLAPYSILDEYEAKDYALKARVRI